MFSRISFKSQPDQYQLVLVFSHAGRLGAGAAGEPRKATICWTAADGEGAVLEGIRSALSDPGLLEDSVRVSLAAPQDAAATHGSVVSASDFQREVALVLHVASVKPALESVEVLRTSGSSGGGMSAAQAQAIWSALELSFVHRVRCTDGLAGLLEAEALGRLASLRTLNLSHSGLASLPGVVGLLQNLEELRLVGNHLKMLPPELGLLRGLRILAADSNELIILPGDLKHCSRLEELTLENNRLTSVLLSFRAFPNLQVLHLFNNPLEFLPEISPCTSLRHLSVANMRVTADSGYTKFQVELLPASVLSGGGGGMGISLFDSSKKEDRLRPIFALMLRRSSGHHPLLAGALRQVAEQGPKNRELMAQQENALQQLVLMALNDNPIVVEQTCITLRLLAQHSPALAEAIVENDVSSVMTLLTSPEERLQLASLRVLAAVAFESQVAAVSILTDRVLAALEGLVLGEEESQEGEKSQEGVEQGGEEEEEEGQRRAAAGALRDAALEALGNLAFAPKNRTRLQARQALMQRVLALAHGPLAPPGPRGTRVKAAAMRVLAVLGENDAVWRAVQRKPLISPRGVRILTMDGGGMKGLATVQLLRELEARTGRRVRDLFDLICGTSTGGLLAVALGLRDLGLDDCEHIYKVLGQKVFSRPLAKQDKEETWMESFYRTFHSKTQHVRAVVVGYKHDAAVYETLLREYCDFADQPYCLADSMIDTACLDVPKVALVAALASVTPAPPFVFRNYELPAGREPLFRQIHAHNGSSKHKVWQAVRASSAATYYLDDFSCGGDKFQDGAVVANNPAIIALQEARLLWPDAPIDVVVSLGSGSTPPARRGAAVSSFMETGSILIESACGVERPAEALATLLPLVPNVKYFRFAPVDERCGMELDEIDPAKWALLEAATHDYIAAVAHKFDDAAAALAEGLEEDEEVPVPPTPSNTLATLRLGPRRQLTLIEAASPAPAPGASPQLGPALAAMFTAVLDVQRQEARGRLARAQALARAPTPRASALSQGPQWEDEAAPVPALHGAAGGAAALETPRGLEDRSDGPGAAAMAAGAAAVAVAAAASAEAADQGGGFSSILSWFSPRSAPSSPGQAAMQHSAADAEQRTSSTKEAKPGINHPPKQQQAFVSFQLGRPSHSPVSAAAGSSSNSSGGGGATTAANPGAGGGEPGQQSVPAEEQQQQQQQQPAASPSTHPAQDIAASAAAVADPAGFLGRELESLFDDDAVEVGACHLALAPAGAGLVLSWHQSVEAVLEPGEAATSLLARLGQDARRTSLLELFEEQPCIPLPPPGDGSSSGSSSGGGGSPAGSLGLLSCHKQWVAGQQLSVLLLQSTVPHVLLTADMLEGELRGALAQQVTVSAAPLPAQMLLALLGGGGAAAVVCPRSSSGEGSGAGEEPAGPRLAPDGRAAEQDMVAPFFLAFYAALKAGATVLRALDMAECAQPALAGTFAVHGMRDGALVVLPGDHAPQL